MDYGQCYGWNKYWDIYIYILATVPMACLTYGELGKNYLIRLTSRTSPTFITAHSTPWNMFRFFLLFEKYSVQTPCYLLLGWLLLLLLLCWLGELINQCKRKCRKLSQAAFISWLLLPFAHFAPICALRSQID